MHYNETFTGAPNFTYGEMIKSQTALRKGIKNIPKERHLEAAKYHAANIMQPVRNAFGPQRITSWYRCAELCVAVGSRPTSNHVTGGTTDFEPLAKKASLLKVGAWIVENRKFTEFIFEYLPYGWLHCASFKGRNERVIKLKDAKHNYRRVSLEYVKKNCKD